MKNKKIAVIGVSSNPQKYGYKIFFDLIKNGYNAYGVNPKLNELNGIKIYPSLKNLPEQPDILILVIPPDVSKDVVKTAIEIGVKEIWFQPGSESKEAIELAKSNNIKTITACFMVSHRIW